MIQNDVWPREANCLCVHNSVTLVLIPELQSSEENKHQYNIQASAQIHTVVYMYHFLSRHNGIINDDQTHGFPTTVPIPVSLDHQLTCYISCYATCVGFRIVSLCRFIRKRPCSISTNTILHAQSHHVYLKSCPWYDFTEHLTRFWNSHRDHLYLQTYTYSCMYCLPSWNYLRCFCDCTIVSVLVLWLWISNILDRHVCQELAKHMSYLLTKYTNTVTNLHTYIFEWQIWHWGGGGGGGSMCLINERRNLATIELTESILRLAPCCQ